MNLSIPPFAQRPNIGKVLVQVFGPDPRRREGCACPIIGNYRRRADHDCRVRDQEQVPDTSDHQVVQRR